MKPTPFNPEKDTAPLPFNRNVCRLAQEMKQLGLKWHPHVGCFVWDPDRHIDADSPFPERIYFVLSMPRFLGIFGSVDSMIQKLVWLPTWHQARTLCDYMQIDSKKIKEIWRPNTLPAPGEELEALYKLVIQSLKRNI